MNPSPPVLQPSRPPDRALDAVNFFLADVRDGLGPYLAIYLLAVHRWKPVSIGAVSPAFGLGAAFRPGLAGMIVQFAGYDVAFLTLAAIAALAFVLAMAMPETRPQASNVTESATPPSDARL